MATLVLRGLPEPLAARLAAYRLETGTSPREAALTLLTAALDAREARQRGAAVVNARLTPEQRSARASHAVSVREARRRVLWQEVP